MSSFTVEAVLGQREWAPKDNPSNKTIYYDLKLQGRDGKVSIGHKPGGIVPTPGHVYDGYAVDEEKNKLVKLKTAFNGGGPRPEDPVRQKKIIRQHSQSTAIELVRLAHDLGVEVQAASVGDLAKRVLAVADALDKDVEGAAS